MEHKMCTQCVMDSTDPLITFNEDGVCNHCTEYAKKEQVRKFAASDRPWIYHQLREAGKGKQYDCLLGLSGGVDSSMCLHYLVENGIRPFCFSVDNGWNTSESDENIMRLVEGLKVPFYRYTINLERFKELQKAFEASGTANLEIPTDHILMATTYEMAEENGIKYIISGGNLATESIMPPSWGYNAKDLKFIKSVYKAYTSRSLKGLPLISLIKYLRLRFLKGINVINLLDYYDYNRKESIKLLEEKYGYKPYGKKHEESKYTKWFQEEYLFDKFGIDKDRAHYSSLINSKQMTRDEALRLLKKRPKKEYPLPRSHKEFGNSEFWWNTLSNIYARIK